MTAPRPRVEGEAEHHFGDQAEPHRSEADRIERERDEARTAVSRLTAEVERLRGVAMDAASRFKGIAHQITRQNPFSLKYDSPHQVSGDIEEQVDRLLAAIALPTPAPEATE